MMIIPLKTSMFLSLILLSHPSPEVTKPESVILFSSFTTYYEGF